nr:GNAT family N-acetyltransferase [Pontibacter sp. E15-1]
MREILESDAQDIFELDSDPEVHTYLGNKPIKSIEEAQGIVNYIREQYKENGIGRWAVIDKKTHEFLGWSGLKYEKVLRKNFPYYDVGYRLKKQYWGKGVATETAVAALAYGFQKLHLPEIYAAAHVENIASNKILQKIGMKFIETFECDGVLNNWYKIERPEEPIKKT